MYVSSVSSSKTGERIVHRAWAPNNFIDWFVTDIFMFDINELISRFYYLKNQALQGLLVDALAHRGYERRDTLRKARRRCE